MSHPAIRDVPLDEPSDFLRLGDDIVLDKDVMVRMRDGISVAVDVYRPAAPGTYPALFACSPYRKDLAYLPPWGAYRTRETTDPCWWARQGYCYVWADTRGSGKSVEGRWRVFDTAEQHDLYDVIEWTAQQEWCTGKVGMVGESYFAMVQWFAAIQNPPHLACIAPFDANCDLYRGFVYHGGLWSMEFVSHWISKVRTRTLRDAPGEKPDDLMGYDVIGQMLRHPLHDEFWNERSAALRLHEIKVPVYSMGVWQSGGVHPSGNILGYEEAQGPKKLAFYGYPGSAQRLFAGKELHLELKRWYDYWLRGIDTGIMDEPPVKYQARPSGEWRSLPSWPPSNVEHTRLYLAPGKADAVSSLNDGLLSWEEPAVDGGSTTYDYPHEEWMGWPGGGTAVMRPDGTLDPLAKIATFSSPPLDRDIEILGPLVLKLWASSDQSDTDFLVKIADQAPTGERGSPPAGVTKGWLKASHRAIDPERSRPDRPWHPHTAQEPLRPGQVYEFDIEIWPTSWAFKKGHRIRLEIAPGDSPPIDGGHDWGIKFGSDTVYHERARPSHLLLPVLSAEC